MNTRVFQKNRFSNHKHLAPEVGGGAFQGWSHDHISSPEPEPMEAGLTGAVGWLVGGA